MDKYHFILSKDKEVLEDHVPRILEPLVNFKWTGG